MQTKEKLIDLYVRNMNCKSCEFYNECKSKTEEPLTDDDCREFMKKKFEVEE